MIKMFEYSKSEEIKFDRQMWNSWENKYSTPG